MNKNIVVIGGGAIGLSAAYYLQQAGHSITVLEKGRYEDGASHGNAGMLVPSHVVPLAAPGVIAQGMRWLFKRDSPFRIKPRPDPALAAWLWKFRSFCNPQHVEAAMPLLRDLSLASVDLFASLAAELPFYFERRGLLMLHHTEKGETENRKYATLAASVGLETRILDTAALRAIEPHVQPPATGAVYYPQDAQINPNQFIAAIRARLEKAGVRCISNAPVTGLEQRANTVVSVKTSDADFPADEVILAAGSWSQKLAVMLNINLPIQPAKGYSITIDAADPSPQIPMILTEAKVTVTPMDNQIRFGGTLELAGFDPAVDRVRAGAILQTAKQYYPAITPASIETNEIWAGYRPCTPDGLPLIGRSTSCKNLVIATGHAMIGMTLAPITGQLVAQLVNEETPSIFIDALNPERFDLR